MKAGFAKEDITPRVGTELAGFGPFICRRSVAVLETLQARAMALELQGHKSLIISCDIIGVGRESVLKIRRLIAKSVKIQESSITIFATHTHSGPNPSWRHGWGECDPAYLEVFPILVAKAGIKAFQNLEEAEIGFAEVDCQGIAINREYDSKIADPSKVLLDDWRPAKPKLTDQKSKILTVSSSKRLLGFVSYFACHPVVCCEQTGLIHGDFCGVGTNMIERDFPGAVGLFIQGAHGDVNTGFAHQPEEESLHALELMSTRYAKSVRAGIYKSENLEIDRLSEHSRIFNLSHRAHSLRDLQAMLSEFEADFSTTKEREELFDKTRRSKIVMILTLRDLIKRLESGQSLETSAEFSALCLGPLKIISSGFEIYQAIKNETLQKVNDELVLIASLANDALGYAYDNNAAKRGGYTIDFAPFILGTLPYANIHEELVNALTQMTLES